MVFLWDLESGNVAFRCAGHDNAVISVNFTPNGENLISSDDKSCRIWNCSNGNLQLTVNVADIVPPLTPTPGGGTASNNHLSGIPNTSSGPGTPSASNVNNNNSSGASARGPGAAGAGSADALGATQGPKDLFKDVSSEQNQNQQGAAANLPGSTVEENNNNSSATGMGTVSISQSYINRLPEALRAALNGRNSLATAKKAFQSTAAISQRIAFTVSCPCPGSFSTGYFAVASTAKSVHIISITTGREETSFVAKAPVFALACGRDEVLMFGDTFGNLYVAELK